MRFKRFARFQGMGDDSLFSSMNAQLNVYEGQMVDLYNQKTKLVADRELARFHYLSSWRSQFEVIMQNIQDDVTQSMSSNALDCIRALFTTFKRTVPMLSLDGFIVMRTDGTNDYAYFYDPMRPSSDSSGNSGFMSPIEVIFGSDPNSGIYRDSRYFTIASLADTLQQTIDQNHLFQLFWVGTDVSVDYNHYENVPFSSDAINRFVNMSGIGRSTVGTWGLSPDEVSKIQALLAKQYAQGSFNDVVPLGAKLWTDLNMLTFNLIRLQFQVDDLEHTVSVFVDKAKTSGALDPSINASDVFKNLQALAKQFNAQSAAQSLSQAQLPQTGAPTATAPKSNVGLLLALAAGAALILGGDHK